MIKAFAFIVMTVVAVMMASVIVGGQTSIESTAGRFDCETEAVMLALKYHVADCTNVTALTDILCRHNDYVIPYEGM